ncbi:hypothetical protein SDRG_04813 [Saprolegnia diclina VS20]|uniref:PLAT domain-containing protein n=1 Tax=Saprolegnia diclina (strain VS20) TaxID=1156394 RepID=T0RYU7_SAPDV|nr:hypothetical protein SDRG_04813 [Saprolegnia diclina VS20]EQC37788.1 hypothetical protein SDRG_04813 [Saprolegnia diclina VS20]|eukprot:XP_008608721.1 hypothetical protein SDRG_04813 [Saprolegnia diclina VS20]
MSSRLRHVADVLLLLGASPTSPSNETNTFYVAFRNSIQSIKLSDDVNLVTYDQTGRNGDNATWYLSTVYTGKWVGRIVSFEVRNATTLPTQPVGTIEAPWRFLGTWEGFMVVRLAARSSRPECNLVNGVICLLGENVDDLLPLLDAYEWIRTSGNNDTSLSKFPAPCGPARREHWGNDGCSVASDWCFQAARRLPLFEVRGSLSPTVSPALCWRGSAYKTLTASRMIFGPRATSFLASQPARPVQRDCLSTTITREVTSSGGAVVRSCLALRTSTYARPS